MIFSLIKRDGGTGPMKSQQRGIIDQEFIDARCANSAGDLPER